MIRIPAPIFGRFDRQEQEDNRTDDEIERQVCERRRARRLAAVAAAKKARWAAMNLEPTPKHSADGEQKTSG